MEDTVLSDQQANKVTSTNSSSDPVPISVDIQDGELMTKKMDTLKPYQLQGEDGTALLDVIDELRSFSTIRQELSLPEIVVVGMQSMGKSSVLKAISGIPFPINQGGCTRFATELILRRSERSTQSVTINDANPSPEKRKKIEQFQERHKDFDLEDLSMIIDEAKRVMNIVDDAKFSDDVLRIECSGPTQHHLTLVDLPGLYHVSAKKSNASDRDRNKSLVRRYMKRERAIILPVVSGSYDYEIKDILEELKDIDQSGTRTLGIITAPDVIAQDSAREKAFLALASNEAIKLRLGWHVLRNPGAEDDDPNMSRDARESQFFATNTSWRNIPPHQRGVRALRKRLRELLMVHISAQMDEILSSIDDTIDRCRSDIARLGEERSRPDQQRQFLVTIGKEFERLTNSALEGEYRDPYFDNPLNRLRARVRNANMVYAEFMSACAHKWQVKGINEETPTFLPAEPSTFSNLTVNVPARLEEAQLIDIVSSMHRSHLGHELQGTFQSALVGKLFRLQSYQWESVTRTHINDIFGIVQDFLKQLIPNVMKDANVRPIFFHIINPALEERKLKLDNKISELLKPFRSGYPMTLNRHFTVKYPQRGAEGEEAINEPNSSMTNKNDAEYISFLHVIKVMQTYYDIALNVFLDNVAALAIEQCLLEDLDQLISPATIVIESDERLELLASESSEAVALRQQLKQRLEEFEKGKATITRHIGRKSRSTEQQTDKKDVASVQLFSLGKSSSRTLQQPDRHFNVPDISSLNLNPQTSDLQRGRPNARFRSLSASAGSDRPRWQFDLKSIHTPSEDKTQPFRVITAENFSFVSPTSNKLGNNIPSLSVTPAKDVVERPKSAFGPVVFDGVSTVPRFFAVPIPDTTPDKFLFSTRSVTPEKRSRSIFTAAPEDSLTRQATRYSPFSEPLSASFVQLPLFANSEMAEKVKNDFVLSSCGPITLNTQNFGDVEKLMSAHACITQDDPESESDDKKSPIKSFEELHLADWNQIHSEPARHFVAQFRRSIGETLVMSLGWNKYYRDFAIYYELCSKKSR